MSAIKRYRSKRIILNKEKYCIVRVYYDKKEMRKDAMKVNEYVSPDIEGVHFPYKRSALKNKNETGMLLLHKNKCGAGVVCHEFMHAILWAFNNKEKQYPILIDSMDEEEEILLGLTKAVKQFYNWYFKRVL